MKHLLYTGLTIFLSLFAANGIAQNLPQEQKASVSAFIENVKTKNWKQMSESINYPLKREYPISPITTSEEFLERQAEVFDEKLISMLTNSAIEDNWSQVGSKGIMFKTGEIWLDENGRMTACNYQSDAEKQLEIDLIQADKDTLPASLKEFQKPILRMRVNKFIVRIDLLKNESYRYSWWLAGTDLEKNGPAEIIQNGILEFEGSGGNHSYTFESDFGKFVCKINELGTSESAPAELTIYRDGQLFRSFDAIWLKN